jgi:site-specific DNA recombinase
VPALVSEDSFARAQELLEQNKIRSRRRTIEPSIVQGLVSCQKCGYAFARTSTRTSARKIHYYKCIGSDGWRKLGGPVCDNGRFVRQDLLDPIVWDEVVRLLEDPTLIQQELDRRLEAARSSNPTKKREQSLQRELAHVGKGIERLLSAYQEALMSIEQLRERMPALRQREQTLRAELQAITDQANDRATFLRLAETLTAFLARLRGAADTLSINERQRIVRLVVKDVLIGEDTITIRHSIPVQQGPPQDSCIPPSQTGNSNYPLCKGRDHASLRRPDFRCSPLPFFHHSGLQPLPYQLQHPPITHSPPDECEQKVMIDRIKVPQNVGVYHPPASQQYFVYCADCLCRTAPRPKPVRLSLEVGFEDWFNYYPTRLLDNPVSHCRDPQGPLAAIRFGDVYPQYWIGLILPSLKVRR